MSKRQRERETAAGRRNLVHSEPVSKKPGPTLLSLTRKREKIPSTSLKRSPRAKRPMTKRFLLPMMMFLKMIRHPVTMMKKHLHLRKRPSPMKRTRILLRRKRPTTRKLLLRNLSQRTTLRMSTTMTATARTISMGRVQFLEATALIMIRALKSIG